MIINLTVKQVLLVGTIGNEWKTAYGDKLLIPKKITLDSLMLMKANQY